MAIARLNRKIVTRALTRAELIFSLVSLALLGGFLVPAHMSTRDDLRTTSHKAYAAVKEVSNALKSYHADYGRFPPVAPLHHPEGEFIFVGDSRAGASTSNGGLFDVLRALDRGVNTNHALNKRQQRYIAERNATDPQRPHDGFAEGNAFPETIHGQFLDTWGSQYCVIMDASGTGSLDLRSIYLDAPNPIRDSVFVFSLGKDRQLGKKGDRKLQDPSGDPRSL